MFEVPMVDYRREKLVSLRELADEIGVAYNSVRRYADRGYPSIRGEVVRLECVSTPSGRKTSIESYYRFLDRINARE